MGELPFNLYIGGGGVVVVGGANGGRRSKEVHRGQKRLGRRIATVSFRVMIIVALMVAGKTWQNRRDVAVVNTAVIAEGAFAGEMLTAFHIVNPYASAGEWYKVQLHMHTREGSLDADWTAEEALQAYILAGYDFVAITDHDTITRPAEVPSGLTLISAEENTVSFPFWPLGQHAVFLFGQEHVRHGSARERFRRAADQGAIVQIAHPNWVGNLGLGRWEMKHLLAASQFHLMEVYNPHSDTRADTDIWHDIVLLRGPGQPVWAVAVDDAHHREGFNLGWTMVKAREGTPDALKEALMRGDLYPTTGLYVEFRVADGEISVQIVDSARTKFTDMDDRAGPLSAQVRFIDAAKQVIHASDDTVFASYRPSGDEGFVRIEVVERTTGRMAWSQPFWLITD